MTIKAGIVAALKANGGITSVVGDYISSNYSPRSTPADFTWIVFTCLQGAETGAMDGDGHLSHPLYQFTVGGPDPDKVDTVKQLLCGFNCTEFQFNAGTPDAPDNRLLTFLHKGDRDNWEEGARVYKVSVDLEVWMDT